MKTAKKTGMSPDVTTLARLFLHACRTHRKPDRMLVKRNGAWRAISSEEIETCVRRLSLGLRDLGLKPGDRVALLSRNRPEWVEADFAVLSAGGVTVPIYTSLPPDLVRYIVDNSGAKIVICEDPDQWKRLEAVRSGLPSVANVVLLDGEAPEGTRTLADVLERGKRLEESAPGTFETRGRGRPARRSGVDHLHLGDDRPPKGVMLSHGELHRQHQVPGRASSISGATTRPSRSSRCPTSSSGRPRSSSSSGARRSPSPRASRPWARISSRSGRPSSSACPGSSKRSTPGSWTRSWPGPASRGRSSSGRWRRRQAGHGQGRRRRTGAESAGLQAGPGPEARLREDHVPDGRPDQVLRLRRRAPLHGHRRVLPRHRARHPARLRADGDVPRPDRQHARRLPVRHGRQGHPRRRAPHRRGRRDPGPRPERHDGILQERGRDPGSHGRGLVPHGRHRPLR